jgi:hypothetical protein
MSLTLRLDKGEQIDLILSNNFKSGSLQSSKFEKVTAIWA